MITKDVPEFTVATTLEDVVRVLADHPQNHIHAFPPDGLKDVVLYTHVNSSSLNLRVPRSVLKALIRVKAAAVCYPYEYVYKLAEKLPPEFELIRVQVQLGKTQW